MKNLHKLISLLLVIVLTVACSSNKDDDPTITITTSEFTVVAEQDSEAVATFSVNVDWATSAISYEGDAKDWLAVTPTSGKAGANQTITLKAAANPAAVERKASFSINYGGKPHKLTITQLGKSVDPTITISTSEFTVGAEQDSEAVATFSVNVDWTISYEGDAKDWLTATPEKGGAGIDQTITIKAAANPSETERVAYLTINYGGEPHKLTITQLEKGIDPTITITTSEFTVSGFSDNEVTATFSINVDWTISYEGDAKDWLTATPEKGEAGDDQTITIKVAENTTTVGRVAYLTINYGDGVKEHKLTVSQISKEETDITAHFNARFASILQKKRYIADSTKILFSDVMNITRIDVFGVNDNLTSLAGIEYFEALTNLECSDNQITFLDVSKNTALTNLSCYFNDLTSLDVSKNTALTILDCNDNQLTSLDVSKNTALTKLTCDYNNLPSLDISKNTALTRFNCLYNSGKDNIFVVKAWFDNSNIPEKNFTKNSWAIDGVTITLTYEKVI